VNRVSVQAVRLTCWQSLDKNDEGSRQASGPWYGGWWIVIFGKNFGESKRGVAALIGGRPCLQTIWIGSQMILCMVPRGPGGEADLKVVANARVMNLPGAVAFELPKVTAVQPSNSPTFGGIFVTLSGARHTLHTSYVTPHTSHITRLTVIRRALWLPRHVAQHGPRVLRLRRIALDQRLFHALQDFPGRRRQPCG
jgi:hypothetical protein